MLAARFMICQSTLRWLVSAFAARRRKDGTGKMDKGQGCSPCELGAAVPSFLPNPSRILLAAMDNWALGSRASTEEKRAVLQSLVGALSEEGVACAPRVESIPYLILQEDPPANPYAAASRDAPPLAELLM